MKPYVALFLLVVALLLGAQPASAKAAPVGTSTTLTSAPNPSAVGEPVTLTATVLSNGTLPTGLPPVEPQPTGTVTFTDTFNGVVTVLGAAGVAGGTASLSTSSLALGSHSIFCTYGGDTNFLTSGSAAVIHIVKASSSTITLSSSTNPSLAGQAVTLQANVSTNGTTSLVGSVSFFDGAALLGTVTSSGGVATLTLASLAVGSHALTATYGNDPAVVDATASLAQIVNKSPSALTLNSSRPGTAPLGASVSFTATVKAVAPATATPSGQVTFANGASILGTATIATGGTATFTTSSLPAGKRTITATFDGDALLTGSSATLAQSIAENAAAVTIVAAPAPSRFGERVTITATVTTTAGVPAGAVTFKIGALTIGTGLLDSSGVATFATNTLPLGSSTITAEFDGAGFYPSGESSTAHTVTKGESSIALSSSPNPSLVGQEVTFSAAISSAAGALGGTIEIFDNERSVGIFEAQGTIGTFRTSALAAGTHSVRVVYRGNGELDGSNSVTITQQVNAPPSATSSTSSSGGSESSPPASAVTVGDDDAGGGCATSPAVGSMSWRACLAGLALAGLLRRRRRA